MKRNHNVKIGYLLPELKWGGSEKHVVQLASGLRERDYEARIICVFREGPLASEAREKGVPFDCLNLPYRWGIGTLLGIRDWIHSHPLDVLHTYLFGFHFFAGLPARLLKVPVVLSSRREISHWQRGRHRWLERAGNLFVDRVVSCSQAVEKWVLEKEKMASGKILTIYNGIDGDRFDPARIQSSIRQEFRIPSGTPLIGTVANLAAEKGYPYLLEAAQLILKKLPEARFLFVGFGPLEREIKEKAKKVAGPEQIIFTGARMDIPELIAAMDVFVLSSVIEGFPNVLLEALAMAKPVVATQVGGIPELIESGRNGILVPPKDGRALAEAVLSLLKDPQGAQAMGQRGGEEVRNRFTLERMLDEYEALYLSLLQSKKTQIPEGREAVLSA